MTTENISQSLPFRVGDVRLLKESEDGVFKTYRIDVDFKKGRGATFDLRGKSLRVSFGALQSLGKKFENLGVLVFSPSPGGRQEKVFLRENKKPNPEKGKG